ncbi:MAG: glycoside hydrolase family 3 C-terminal domain-containing protein, partial [Bacilli bacterium]|nr:glycoside hydrolase family 3 C-terminal domain-containing protein [Bacilli bacterium]
NEIEDPRHNNTANIPEQALWEIYIEPFYKSVKKGNVASVMESYNAVNNEFMTRNRRLLQEILKDKIGFAGFVMSDWWAINTDSYENFGNGCDMNMPGGPGWTEIATGKDGSWWSKIPDWIENGYITQDRVDDAARRIIAAMYKVNLIDDAKTLTDADYYPNRVNLDAVTISEDTKGLNREVGQESIVLLKNEDNILPLTNLDSYASYKVFGNSAAESECLTKYDCTCKGDESSYERGEETRYFSGYVGLGWGSGTTHFEYQVTPLAAISERLTGKTFSSSTDLEGDYTNFKEKLPTAAGDCADLNIVFIAADSGEEYIKVEGLLGDRTSLDAWHGGNDLVDKVSSVCSGKDIVLVILGPTTVTIKSEWKATSSNIKAILFGGMLGAEGGNAIADVLFGDVNPSGHLTFVWAPVESYPNVTKTPSTSGVDYIQYDYNYVEGLFVGQRYVDKYNKEFDYPFGFGLSYTSFTFANLLLIMGPTGLTVRFNVTNTGSYDGKVVPMVFLKIPIDNYPEKVLRGFDKKLIKQGETESFEIFIDNHDLSYYDVNVQDFVKPKSGKYTVYVGEHAKDDKLVGTVDVNWNEYYEKADKFLKDFSLEEKMLLLYSTENMIGKCVGSIDANKDKKFPGLCLQD